MINVYFTTSLELYQHVCKHQHLCQYQYKVLYPVFILLPINLEKYPLLTHDCCNFNDYQFAFGSPLIWLLPDSRPAHWVKLGSLQTFVGNQDGYFDTFKGTGNVQKILFDYYLHNILLLFLKLYVSRLTLLPMAIVTICSLCISKMCFRKGSTDPKLAG